MSGIRTAASMSKKDTIMSDDDENMSESDDIPDYKKCTLTSEELKAFSSKFATYLMTNALSYEKSVPKREIPEDPKEIQPYSMVAAVLSDEILCALPNCLNIILREFARKQKIGYKQVDDFRVFFGTLAQVNAVMRELPNLVTKYRSTSMKYNKKRSREQSETQSDDPAPEKDDSPPKLPRRYVKKEKGVYDQILRNAKDNIIQTPTSNPEGRRLSGRLSAKPRKSYATLFTRPTGIKTEKPEVEDADSDRPVDIDEEVKKLQEEAINKRLEETKKKKVTVKKDIKEDIPVPDMVETPPPVMRKRGRPSKQKEGDSDVTCDICLKTFPFPGVMKKHRTVHFKADGELGEAAIIMHIAVLKEKEMAENLAKDLTIQVQRYQERQGKESRIAMSDIVNDDTIKEEEETESERPKRRGRKPLCEMTESPDAESVQTPGTSGNQRASFACDECCCKLLTEKALIVHKKYVHQKEKKMKVNDKLELKCPHCDFVSNRTQNFGRHIKSHGRPNLFRCNLCNYSNKMRSEVLRHQRNTHAKKSFKCDECGSMHRNKSLLAMHVNLKHRKVYSVICDQCGKELISRKAYQTHIEKHHKAKEAEKESKTQIMCNMCARILPSNKSFEQHLAKFHGQDKDSLEMKKVNEGVQILESEFQCKHCLEYRNTSAREVRRHILRVHMSRLHQCDQCKAAFPLEKLLQKHIRVVHYGLEKKKCPDCNKWFRNNSFLTAHVKRVHSGEANECTVCNKQFTDKRTLECHSELHKPPEERTYKFSCDVCDKKFRVLSNLEYHIMSHTGERPHACEHCGKSFKAKHILDRHLTTHSDERPFKCHVCGKLFKLKKYLDVHTLVHTGDKYVCAQCQKPFGNEEALEKHICKVMVVGDGPQEGDRANATRVELVNVAAPDGSLITANLINSFPEEDKQDVQMYCYMCSSCGTGFVDTESAASHVCPIQTKVADAGAKMIEDDDQMDGLTHGLDDHQHYSVTEEQMQPPSMDAAEMETQGVFDGNAELPDGKVPLTMIQVGSAGLAQAEPITDGTGMVVSTDPAQEEEPVAAVEAADVPPVEMYMCGICNTLFMTQNEVQDHLQVHIQEMAAASVPEDQQEEQQEDATAAAPETLQLPAGTSLTITEQDHLDAAEGLSLPMEGII